MGETFSKKDKEKKKAKERQDKAEKMKERKANAKKGKSLEEMMAYLDEDGNLSSTPPNPDKKRTINAEDISLDVSRPSEPEETTRQGIVTHYNDEKGYGFITDNKSKENIFVHANNTSQPLKLRDMVSFEVERDKKGLHAVNVKKI